MKLDDFLKCKKVRCVSAGEYIHITVGKVYDVIGLDKTCVHVTDDDGKEACHWYYYFEPVLDSAETPLQGVELTPEFEAAETVLADISVNIQDIGTDILDTNADIKDTHKFKAGDRVYVGLTRKIARVTKIIDDDVVNVANKNNEVRVWISNICHATQENYEMLCKLYPHIEFEAPHKELTGSDLARALIKKGWFGFNCLCGNSGDKNAITETIVTGVNNSGQFTAIDGRLFNNAIPVIGLRALEAREVWR